jgi:hypothetical protein
MALILDGTSGLSDVDGTAGTPAIRGSDANTGVFFGTDIVGVSTGGSERMRVDASGNVGIGTSSPGSLLQVEGAISMRGVADVRLTLGSAGSVNANTSNYIRAATDLLVYNTAAGRHSWEIGGTERARIDSSGNLLVGGTSQSGTANRAAVFSANKFGLSVIDTTAQTTGVGGALNLGGNYRSTGDAQAFCRVAAAKENSTDGNFAYAMTFATTPNGGTFTEAARIDSSGNLLVGTTAVGGVASGKRTYINIGNVGELYVASDGGEAAIFNRNASDGVIVSIRQGNVQEGNISVSGTTVSYNGGHLSRWAQTTTAKDESLVKGTVLSNLDEMNVYTDAEGNTVENEQLNKVKVSDVEGDANVAGVFVNWEHDEAHNVDEINMAMTGDMIIRIAQGVTVARGDLLMSAGDGTAKPQGDDIVRAKTIAKVTSTHVTCTYADGSFCVPCVLMAC